MSHEAKMICAVCGTNMKMVLLQQQPGLDVIAVYPCECKGIPPILTAPAKAKVIFLDNYRKNKNVKHTPNVC